MKTLEEINNELLIQHIKNISDYAKSDQFLKDFPDLELDPSPCTIDDLKTKNDGDNGSTEADESDLDSTESEVEVETPEESEPTNGGNQNKNKSKSLSSIDINNDIKLNDKMKNAILDCWNWIEPKPRTKSIWLSSRLRDEKLLKNREELIDALRNIIEPIKDEILNLED